MARVISRRRPAAHVDGPVFCLGVETHMECKKGTSAMLEWRSRFLAEGTLDEDAYDEALRSAGVLEQAGEISTLEWIELVRLANTALLHVR